MNRFLKPGAIFIIIIGSQVVLLGALYKIQSWSPPHIFGMEFNLLLCGLILSLGGAAMLVIGKRKAKDLQELYETKGRE